MALDTIAIAPKLLQPLHVHVDSDLFVVRYIKRLDCLKSFPLGDIARYNCESVHSVSLYHGQTKLYECLKMFPLYHGLSTL